MARGDEVRAYYGAADTVIGVAIARMEDLPEFVYSYDDLMTV